MLSFIVVLVLATLTQGYSPYSQRMLDVQVDESGKPTILHKNETLLKINNGTATVFLQADDRHEPWNHRGAMKVELKIEEGEQSGKVYTDFAFDDWAGNHQAEILGKSPSAPHHLVFNRGSLYFRYNETAPNFTLTITKMSLIKGCDCGWMSTEYPHGIRQPSRFPGAVLTLDFPKNCSQMFCGWKSRENMKRGQEVDFSFLGNYDPKDRFYIRDSTGMTSLLPESGPFKRFKMLINEPFMIYFVGSDQAKNDRHISLQFAYEANI